MAAWLSAYGLGLMAYGVRAWGIERRANGFGAHGLWLMTYELMACGLGLSAHGFGFRAYSFELRAHDLGFRV